MLTLSLKTENVQIGDKVFTMKEMSGEEVETFVLATREARNLLEKAEKGQSFDKTTIKQAEVANLKFWQLVLRDETLTAEWVKKNTNDRFAKAISEKQIELNEFESHLGNLKIAMILAVAVGTALQLGPTLSELSQTSTN